MREMNSQKQNKKFIYYLYYYFLVTSTIQFIISGVRTLFKKYIWFISVPQSNLLRVHSEIYRINH